MSREVLIVEDDPDIAQLVKLQLADIDCRCRIIGNGREALEHLQRDNSYQLVILDIMLPDLDGLSICRDVRAQTNYTPILMLTAKSSELDRVLGLEIGADDYLTKPFSSPELTARAKALFRLSDALSKRDSEPLENGKIQTGNLTINLNSREVVVSGANVTLTAREFDLLVHFTRHPGQVFTRSQLLDAVWGYSRDGYEHTVNTHINRLRGKIETQPDHPEYIGTVWGVGYQFRQAEPAPA